MFVVTIFRIRYSDIPFVIGVPEAIQRVANKKAASELVFRPEQESGDPAVYVINFMDYVHSESYGNYREELFGKDYKQAIRFMFDFVCKDLVNIDSLQSLYQLFVEDMLKVSLREPLMNMTPCSFRITVPQKLLQHFSSVRISDYYPLAKGEEFYDAFVREMFSIYYEMALLPESMPAEKYILSVKENLRDEKFKDTLCRLGLYQEIRKSGRLLVPSKEDLI